MSTATLTIEAPVTQGVCRYPIGLPLDRPTLRWFAEIITPNCDVCPITGRLVDAAKTVIRGDIEYTPGDYPGYVPEPDPGTRAMAMRLAGDIAHPLGFTVGAVWVEGQTDQEF
jgi:hypothetical protein